MRGNWDFKENPFAFAVLKVERDQSGTLINYVLLDYNDAFKALNYKKTDICKNALGTALCLDMNSAVRNWTDGITALRYFSGSVNQWVLCHFKVLEPDVVLTLHVPQHDIFGDKGFALFNQTNDGIFFLNLEGNHIDVNNRACELLGYTRAELMTMGLKELSAELDSSMSVLVKLLSGEKVPPFDRKFRRKDGSIVPLEMNVELIRDAAGAPLYILSIARDISERVRFEKEIKNQVAFQDLVTDISTDFIHVDFDTFDHKIEHLLRRTAQFFDVERGYLYLFSDDGKTMTKTHEYCVVGLEKDMSRFRSFPLSEIPWWRDQIMDNEAVYIESVEQMPEGAESEKAILSGQHVVSCLAIPIRVNQKSIGFFGYDALRFVHVWSSHQIHFLYVLSSVIANAHLKCRFELDLVRAKEAAESANLAKSQFLANMSHEIRTPLNAIIGFTELLMGSELSSSQKQYVENAHASGRALLSIVNDILDLSKIEAGKLELEHYWVDYRAMLMEVEEMVALQAKAKGIEIVLCVADKGPDLIWADGIRLRQIVLNLMSNAVKFTLTGRIEFGVLSKGHGVFEFFVKDTGIGISQENQKRLFKAFTQADTTTTRKFGGTGLGLVISSHLAEKMGSKITIKSEMGKGSHFGFKLRTKSSYSKGKEMHSQASLQSVVAVNNTLSGKTVLIAEDVATNRLLIRIVLSKAFPELEIIEADNGRDAVATCMTRPIDLVLMDVQMPEMDGIDATRVLTKHFGNRLPIVALTAGALEEERTRCLEAGMVDFLTKPIERNVLIDTILRNFGGKDDGLL